jgi:hypothetical protein
MAEILGQQWRAAAIIWMRQDGAFKFSLQQIQYCGLDRLDERQGLRLGSQKHSRHKRTRARNAGVFAGRVAP